MGRRPVLDVALQGRPGETTALRPVDETADGVGNAADDAAGNGPGGRELDQSEVGCALSVDFRAGRLG